MSKLNPSSSFALWLVKHFFSFSVTVLLPIPKSPLLSSKLSDPISEFASGIVPCNASPVQFSFFPPLTLIFAFSNFRAVLSVTHPRFASSSVHGSTRHSHYHSHQVKFSPFSFFFLFPPPSPNFGNLPFCPFEFFFCSFFRNRLNQTLEHVICNYASLDYDYYRIRSPECLFILDHKICIACCEVRRAMRDRLFVVFRVFFPDAERIWVVHVNFFVFCEDSTKGLPSCLEILVLLY